MGMTRVMENEVRGGSMLTGRDCVIAPCGTDEAFISDGHTSVTVPVALLATFLESLRAQTGIGDCPPENADAKRLLRQLAWCLHTAEGQTQKPVERGEYEWSPAYEAVLDLRRRHEVLTKACAAFVTDVQRPYCDTPDPHP